MQVFDRVPTLYEGKQIYFRPANEVKEFFITLRLECPERQITADFLTSLTSPSERIVKDGFEDRVPKTPDEFVAAWKNGPGHAKLTQEIDEYEQLHPIVGESLDKFIASRRAQQAGNQ